uniref:tRNA (adenine(58)-N(1))-methyltransferase catalytic subunit TRMT61A n=1 Tax=Globodera rostochiensis TaxID=31243 RepID=A0A914IDL1_GLORO
MEKGSNFLRNSDTVEEGDTVIVYVNPSTKYSVVVKRGHTLHMKYGALRHEFLIGKRYGTTVSASAGYVYVLRANPNMWTRTLQKSTQILYTPDIGTILLLLDVKPGARICETGTGSGSLSHAIATAVAPDGHLYSYDIDEQRVKAAQKDLKLHGLAQCATIQCQDVCQHGFSVPSTEGWRCDGVFLDLPAPWLAIAHAHKVLQNAERPSRLVSFSPCIEQVQQVCTELEQHGFVDIETVEVVPQKMKLIDVPSESLLEFAAKGANAPAFLQKKPADDQQKSRRGAKRKAADDGSEQTPDKCKDEYESGGDETVAAVNGIVAADPDNDDGPQMLTDAVPCPLVQPTHTGYITSATLLPRIVVTPEAGDVPNDTTQQQESFPPSSPHGQQQ